MLTDVKVSDAIHINTRPNRSALYLPRRASANQPVIGQKTASSTEAIPSGPYCLKAVAAACLVAYKDRISEYSQ